VPRHARFVSYDDPSLITRTIGGCPGEPSKRDADHGTDVKEEKGLHTIGTAKLGTVLPPLSVVPLFHFGQLHFPYLEVGIILSLIQMTDSSQGLYVCH
jgi:hypothetical protein